MTQQLELIKVPLNKRSLCILKGDWGTGSGAGNRMISRTIKKVCEEGVWTVPNDPLLSYALKREVMIILNAKHHTLAWKTQQVFSDNTFHANLLHTLSYLVWESRQDSPLTPTLG
jgi:hypothetical protein